MNDVKEYNIFNLNNPYSNNLKVHIELKCMVALRMLGRDMCDDIYEMPCIPISSKNVFSKYVYIPKDEELKSILKLYEM